MPLKKCLTEQANAGEQKRWQGIEIGQLLTQFLAWQKVIVLMFLVLPKVRGFQGVVKRHGFSGGPASHGATFGTHSRSFKLYEKSWSCY